MRSPRETPSARVTRSGDSTSPGCASPTSTSTSSLERLAEEVKQVLADAIERGGTTLRDFLNASGQPGYFAQELLVYGRAGQPCKRCGATLKTRQIGQRASAYCPSCQR